MSQVYAQRGHIYRIAFHPDVTVLGLIVSTDKHNRDRDEYITVQVTSGSGDQRGLPGSVRLGAGDPGYGYVVVRDIGMVGDEELREDLGEVSPETMAEVGRALKMVLGL